jgi:outer membrane protein
VNTKFFVGPALVLAAAFGAQAQTQPGKVGVIAIQQAIISTKDGQKAAADLDAKTAPKKKAIEEKQNNITTLQDQLNKGQNTLSEATKTDLYKNIESKKKSLQRDIEDAQAELDQDQQKVLQQLGAKIMAVIEKYARDHGFTMVVDVSSPQSPILYASPSIDITKEIIELYDQSTAAMSAPATSAKPAAAPPAAAPKTPAPAPAKPPATPTN